jgi:hypothetical protein
MLAVPYLQHVLQPAKCPNNTKLNINLITELRKPPETLNIETEEQLPSLHLDITM